MSPRTKIKSVCVFNVQYELMWTCKFPFSPMVSGRVSQPWDELNDGSLRRLKNVVELLRNWRWSRYQNNSRTVLMEVKNFIWIEKKKTVIAIFVKVLLTHLPWLLQLLSNSEAVGKLNLLFPCWKLFSSFSRKSLMLHWEYRQILTYYITYICLHLNE